MIEGWKLVEAVLGVADRIILLGPPSTGKTYAALNYGLRDAQKVYALTLDEGTMTSEVRGCYLPDGKGGIAWADGPGTLAAKSGSRLVLNEICRGSEEIKGFLYGLCDSQETAIFTLPTGEVVRPVAGFQVVATDNGTVQDLPEGIQSRFPVAITIDKVAPGALKQFPKALRTMIEETATVEDVTRRIDVRAWQSYILLKEQLGHDVAADEIFKQRRQDVEDTLLLIENETALPKKMQ